MIDLLKWYLGIGLVFLLLFEWMYYFNREEMEKEQPEHARELTWKERIVTILLWPYYIFFLFFGK